MKSLRVSLSNLVGWLILGYFVIELVLDVCSGWWRVRMKEVGITDE